MSSTNHPLANFAKLLGQQLRTRRRSRVAMRRPRHLRLESLERREVFDAALESIYSLGSEDGNAAVAAIVTDSLGNSYTTGRFSGTVDFDQAVTRADNSDVLTSRGVSDAFVAKYDAADRLIWARRMGGEESNANYADLGSAIELDGAGNVIVAGRFFGTADFGSTQLTSVGDADGFVTKLTNSGTFVWARRWGYSGSDGVLNVDVDSNGNIYTASARFSFGTDIQKWSANGSLVWSQSVQDRSRFSGDIQVDRSGNVFVVGSFQGTVDFDPSSKTHNASSGSYPSGYVLKLTTTGKYSWVKTFTGNSSGWATAQTLAIDTQGNLFVAGMYSGAVDFDPGWGVKQLPGSGGFISRLTSSGSLTWVQGLESTGSSVLANDIAFDGAGGIYVAGSFVNAGSVDFDPGAGVVSRTNAGEADIFLLSLNSSGNFNWVETIGGAGYETASGLSVAPDGSILLAGYYKGAVDFNTDPLLEDTLQNSGLVNSGYVARYRKR